MVQPERLVRPAPATEAPSHASGTLYVVATPIGHLEDITLRALRTLREVSLIAAEDTRRTAKLLRHYQITTPLISLRQHNERQRGRELLARLVAGESMAMVSDAGTPTISDPGAVFVRMARDAGVRVDPVPGPSAVTAALSGSGLDASRYMFAGFPPIKSNDRKTWLSWVSQATDVPVVCFEAPHRVRRTVTELLGYLVNRPIIVIRELTKIHEQWKFITVASAAVAADKDNLARQTEPRGEYVLIIAPEKRPITLQASDESIQQSFGRLTSTSVFGSRKEAIREVARQVGLSPKAVYDALERTKQTP